jgi:hypothetical protein
MPVRAWPLVLQGEQFQQSGAFVGGGQQVQVVVYVGQQDAGR